MAQTTVSDQPFAVYDGKLEDCAERTVSGLAAAEVVFGKAVGTNPAALVEYAGEGGRQVSPIDATFSEFEGISILDHGVEQDGAAGYGSYPVGEAVACVRKGRVWVKVPAAVTAASEVWVRNANAAASPDGALGSFRGNTATDYIRLDNSYAIRWLGGRSEGGSEFGLLEINLP